MLKGKQARRNHT